MPLASAKAIQISGTSTPSMSRQVMYICCLLSEWGWMEAQPSRACFLRRLVRKLSMRVRASAMSFMLVA